MSNQRSKTLTLGYALFVIGIVLSLLGATVVYWGKVLDHPIPYYHLAAFTPVSIGLIIVVIGLSKIANARID